MNGLLIGLSLLSGGSAVAMQNTEVNTVVNETAKKVMSQVKTMFQGNQIENVRENGFSYPSEEFLSNLTEDQSFEIISTIDQINAFYDWSNMTDEEITEALVAVKAEMNLLYTELGIEGPMTQTQTRTRTRSRNGKNWNEDFENQSNQENAPSEVESETENTL